MFATLALPPCDGLRSSQHERFCHALICRVALTDTDYSLMNNNESRKLVSQT